ncbi:MAG: nicotinate (nicotinamide) nucleotide adenylyltransferase [Chlamydiae bacterium]|nr:nicotinate (nicotinamide) nucleotide adenylyltransferase [Chlamydiota bacterium]
MKKIGFYGGTFDPIHFGHLFLAIQLAEAKRLDEVWICPAFCSPFKQGVLPKASAEHRLEMVRLAVEEIPNFKVLSSEVENKKISYTIDTLRDLPTAHYHLLLSEESASEFMKWKEPGEIARIAPPLIGCREIPQHIDFQRDDWRKISFLQEGLVLTKRMEISSTEIRGRLKNKLYSGHLLPAKALDYIRRHQLYFR